MDERDIVLNSVLEELKNKKLITESVSYTHLTLPTKA